MRVVQRRDGSGFAIEPLAQIGIGGDVRGQDLDGDRAIEAGIARLVDLAHAAGANCAYDLIRPETRAGG